MAKRLSPLDGSWLMVESAETPMHVAGLQTFTLPKDAPRDFMQDLFAYFRGYKAINPPFNYRLKRSPLSKVMPAWEELNDIDMDYHVRLSALPKPGGERELGVLISRLHSIPLDMTRPLWECHLIEGLENHRFAIYVKAHHSLLDGMAAVKIVQSTLSENPHAKNVPPPWGSERIKKSRVEKAAGEIVSPLNLLLQQATGQFKTISGLYKSLSAMTGAALKHTEGGLVGPYTAPKSVLNVPITGQRRFATQSYDFARIRKLCETTGATVNDIVLAICAGALRRYLQEINALPDKPLVANLPVSIRPKDDDGAGNAISAMLVSLATDVEDVRERLDAIRASTSQAKAHLQQMPRAAINNYTMVLMAPFILGQIAGLSGSRKPMFNVAISNVPGPKQPLYLNGARMEALYPVSLIFNGQALNITVFTYADRLNFSFTACRDSLPRVQRLAVYTGEALEELEGVKLSRPKAIKKVSKHREK